MFLNVQTTEAFVILKIMEQGHIMILICYMLLHVDSGKAEIVRKVYIQLSSKLLIPLANLDLGTFIQLYIGKLYIFYWK